MNIPTIRGLIDRRILLNYRVDPAVLAPLLPAPFRPKLVRGFGLAGICLIRLKRVRPRCLPGWLGISSENAAHRVAVEWSDGDTVREGVYIFRRDTNRRFNAWAGGRLFPGVHHRANFTVKETNDLQAISVQSDDGGNSISVHCQVGSQLPANSVFSSLAEAAAFFQGGSIGYSPSSDPTRLEGLELRCHTLRMEPLAVTGLHSHFFEDENRFPSGSIQFDSALLMRGIEHDWHGLPVLRTTSPCAECCGV